MKFEAYIRKILIKLLYSTKNLSVQKLIDELDSNQWLSLEEIKNLQWEKISKLINNAYRNVEYYKNLFDLHGIHPKIIQDFSDFKKIPILSKNNIRANLNSLVSYKSKFKKLHLNSTGGSTGKPVKFYQDNNYIRIKKASIARSWYNFVGFENGELTAVLWGADRDLSIKPKFKERFLNYLYGERGMNSFLIDDMKLNKFLQDIVKHQYKILRGYASSLYMFSLFLLKREIQLNKVSQIEIIISCAESLPETQRKVMEKAFGCKVLNFYGTREVGPIAMECDYQNGLHVFSDTQYVEIEPLEGIKDIKENNIGQIIITNLSNFAMPFIRYAIEDTGCWEENDTCLCNRNLPRLKKISGRMTDVILTPSGKVLVGELFPHFIKDFPIKMFQLIQENDYSLQLSIIPEDNFSEIHENQLKSDIMTHLNEYIPIKIKKVDKLEKTRSGKLIIVKSKIAQKKKGLLWTSM